MFSWKPKDILQNVNHPCHGLCLDQIGIFEVLTFDHLQGELLERNYTVEHLSFEQQMSRISSFADEKEPE